MNRLIDRFKLGLSAARSTALCFFVPLALLPVAGVSPAMAAQRAPSTASDLQHAVAALRGITTLRADFTQTNAAGQMVSGVLTLKQPGKIRFQYGAGVPMLIIGDGRALTVIDSEVNQIQRWPIGNSPLGALLDPTRDVSRYGTVVPSFDPGSVNIEVRDRGHPEYGVITLVFARKPAAPGGLELIGWVALDAQNRRTVIRLSNHRYGLAVPDSLFRFVDPRARPHK